MQQAQVLIAALAAKRPAELASAWGIAWNTGARWRAKLDAGRKRLPAETRDALRAIVESTWP